LASEKIINLEGQLNVISQEDPVVLDVLLPQLKVSTEDRPGPGLCQTTIKSQSGGSQDQDLQIKIFSREDPLPLLLKVSKMENPLLQIQLLIQIPSLNLGKLITQNK
jgi:hypothetical protein